MRIGGQDFRRQLLERRDVVQDPESAPVGRQREVVEALLHGDPIDGSVRQTALQRLPVLSIVE